ncbi:hypothetical protein R1flu_022785 [Riccia fluitans]|uniref:Uncharacterized protein n=1 Tax=Riccia fluitans TaxID=41844 RepID=A0ABD1XQ67_9MARC
MINMTIPSHWVRRRSYVMDGRITESTPISGSTKSRSWGVLMYGDLPRWTALPERGLEPSHAVASGLSRTRGSKEIHGPKSTGGGAISELRKFAPTDGRTNLRIRWPNDAGASWPAEVYSPIQSQFSAHADGKMLENMHNSHGVVGSDFTYSNGDVDRRQPPVPKLLQSLRDRANATAKDPWGEIRTGTTIFGNSLRGREARNGAGGVGRNLGIARAGSLSLSTLPSTLGASAVMRIFCTRQGYPWGLEDPSHSKPKSMCSLRKQLRWDSIGNR